MCCLDKSTIKYSSKITKEFDYITLAPPALLLALRFRCVVPYSSMIRSSMTTTLWLLVTARHVYVSVFLLWPLYPDTHQTQWNTAQSLWSLLLLLEASSSYFYVMHRLLHYHPELYRRFNQQHHQLETPVWQATLYCSLVEHICVNTGSLFVPFNCVFIVSFR